MHLQSLLKFSAVILFFGPILRQLLVPNSSNSTRKWSQWNYHTKPIVELPLAEGAVLQYSRFQHFFIQFYASFSILVIILNFCNTVRQLLVPNSRTFFLNNPVLAPVPVKLPCWNCPWPRGAVQQYPTFLHFFLQLLQLLAFQLLVYNFCNIFLQILATNTICPYRKKASNLPHEINFANFWSTRYVFWYSN